MFHVTRSLVYHVFEILPHQCQWRARDAKYHARRARIKTKGEIPHLTHRRWRTSGFWSHVYTIVSSFSGYISAARDELGFSFCYFLLPLITAVAMDKRGEIDGSAVINSRFLLVGISISTWLRVIIKMRTYYSHDRSSSGHQLFRGGFYCNFLV